MGSYTRFEHYLTTLEVQTRTEFWPPSPVSCPLGADDGKGQHRRQRLDKRVAVRRNLCSERAWEALCNGKREWLFGPCTHMDASQQQRPICVVIAGKIGLCCSRMRRYGVLMGRPPSTRRPKKVAHGVTLDRSRVPFPHTCARQAPRAPLESRGPRPSLLRPLPRRSSAVSQAWHLLALRAPSVSPWGAA